jgi:hypothetical protein
LIIKVVCNVAILVIRRDQTGHERPVEVKGDSQDWDDILMTDCGPIIDFLEQLLIGDNIGTALYCIGLDSRTVRVPSLSLFMTFTATCRNKLILHIKSTNKTASSYLCDVSISIGPFSLPYISTFTIGEVVRPDPFNLTGQASGREFIAGLSHVHIGHACAMQLD